MATAGVKGLTKKLQVWQSISAVHT